MITTAPTPTASGPNHAQAPTSLRILSGFQPTGPLHLGNYLGAIQPLRHLADQGHRVTVLIADLHALTKEHEPDLLRRHVQEVAATLIACGLDPARPGIRLLVQSDLGEHAELAYLMEATATYGELARMIQFRQSAGRRAAARAALLTYPALMAADILLHAADQVPVGEDQSQHLELARTLARRFNRTYGEVFTEPQPLLGTAATRVKNLRRPEVKMGKSDADQRGVVHLTDEPTRIAATVRSAVTDLDPRLAYDPQLRPGVANLAEILGALTRRAPAAVLGGLAGASGLKAVVTQQLVEHLTPIRQRYLELIGDPAMLNDVLAAGAEAVRPGARELLDRARAAIGLGGRRVTG